MSEEEIFLDDLLAGEVLFYKDGNVTHEAWLNEYGEYYLSTKNNETDEYENERMIEDEEEFIFVVKSIAELELWLYVKTRNYPQD